MTPHPAQSPPKTTPSGVRWAEAFSRPSLLFPHDQRLAVVLIDVQGLAYEEAAEVMGINVGTVKSRLSRGRGRIRDLLREKPGILPARYGSQDRERD